MYMYVIHICIYIYMYVYTHLSAYIQNPHTETPHQCFSIEITKGYGKNEWREDLKRSAILNPYRSSTLHPEIPSQKFHNPAP